MEGNAEGLWKQWNSEDEERVKGRGRE